VLVEGARRLSRPFGTNVSGRAFPKVEASDYSPFSFRDNRNVSASGFVTVHWNFKGCWSLEFFISSDFPELGNGIHFDRAGIRPDGGGWHAQAVARALAANLDEVLDHQRGWGVQKRELSRNRGFGQVTAG